MGTKRSSLYHQLHQIPGNQHDLCRVRLLKDRQSKSITDLILHEAKEGLFVVLLKDLNRNRLHAVGIDVAKQLIYDCMENKALVLNVNNLSICCGKNAVFSSIAVAGELKAPYKRPKQTKPNNTYVKYI